MIFWIFFAMSVSATSLNLYYDSPYASEWLPGIENCTISSPSSLVLDSKTPKTQTSSRTCFYPLSQIRNKTLFRDGFTLTVSSNPAHGKIFCDFKISGTCLNRLTGLQVFVNYKFYRGHFFSLYHDYFTPEKCTIKAILETSETSKDLFKESRILEISETSKDLFKESRILEISKRKVWRETRTLIRSRSIDQNISVGKVLVCLLTVLTVFLACVVPGVFSCLILTATFLGANENDSIKSDPLLT
jgi:hypothetical protein